MTNLEKLTKRIHELLPETMELTPNCLIEAGERIAYSKGISLDQNPLKIISICSDPHIFLVLTSIGIEHFNWRDIDLHCKVLGHPIQLHHVLRAIDMIDKREVRFINVEGWFADGYAGTLGGMEWKWDLTKPLDGQSEETIEFISSLIDA